MWTNKQASYPPGAPGGTAVGTLPEPVPTTAPATASVTTPVAATRNPPEAPRPHAPVSRALACLGPGLKIKGQISGTEDLQVEGTVEGPISLGDHRLTVGQNAHVSGEITASEVVVYGQVTGNLLASGRIEIKNHGSVVGDMTTSRIMIEDGAYFKGAIEIARKT
jgi:cytoskeletal protein CcmA (bactofilin family)